MFNIGDKVEFIDEDDDLDEMTVGGIYTVEDPQKFHEFHAILSAYDYQEYDSSADHLYTHIINDDGVIEGYPHSCFELVETSEIDYLQIAKDICGEK